MLASLIFEIPVIIGAIEFSRIILFDPLFKVAFPYFKTPKNDVNGYTSYFIASILYYLLVNNFLLLPIYLFQIFIGTIIVCAILCKITPLWEILTTSFNFSDWNFSYSTNRTLNLKEINTDFVGDLIIPNNHHHQLLYNNERNKLLQFGILLSKDNNLSILKKSFNFNQNAQQKVQFETIIMNASVLVKLTRLLSITPQRSKPSQYQSYRKHRTRNLKFLPSYNDNNEKLTFPRRQRLICDSQVSFDPSEIHVAPPGDLFLSEKINDLDKELVDLTEHEIIARNLIKQKKEIDVIEMTKKIQGLISQIKRIGNQKQQYQAQAQENIISKDVTKLSIPAFTIKQENSKKFAVYIVMVQRLNTSTGQVKAGWIVPRRYNEFSSLNQHLKKHHSEFINKFEFPGKTLFNNLDHSFLESRRIQFENYLQGLLVEDVICEDKGFLKFLSKGN